MKIRHEGLFINSIPLSQLKCGNSNTYNSFHRKFSLDFSSEAHGIHLVLVHLVQAKHFSYQCTSGFALRQVV